MECNGSCLIGEADSESQERGESVSRWDSPGSEPEELILSIREMPTGTFLSRWWPSEYTPDEGMLRGRLDGGICDNFYWARRLCLRGMTSQVQFPAPEKCSQSKYGP